MTDPINFKIDQISLAEQSVRLRLPFRFGLITLTEAPQVFVSVRLSTGDKKSAIGLSASMLVPKWFDKLPENDNETNIAHLRRALELSAQAYQSEQQRRNAFGYFAAYHHALVDAGAREGINALSSNFGAAMIDAAIIDALGQLADQSFYGLVKSNRLGICPADMLAEFAGFDMSTWLQSLRPAQNIAARHTVGLVDPIDSPQRTVNDGLPETLPQVIDKYGHRYFKLKVSGDIVADIDRLEQIAAVLDRAALPYRVTLDGNEQFDNADAVNALWAGIAASPKLKRLVESIEFIEQPIKRSSAMNCPVHSIARHRPLIIDESDDSLEAFPAATRLGYSGVSSKLCKGVYKSLINAARCSISQTSGRPFFMSAEDLTNQAGVAVQQDLALVSLIGLTHVERNGHHYVNGLASAAPQVQNAFLAGHPDLYESTHDAVRLRIADGSLMINSLDVAGFGVARGARQALRDVLWV